MLLFWQFVTTDGALKLQRKENTQRKIAAATGHQN